jgi:hypothetical protein
MRRKYSRSVNCGRDSVEMPTTLTPIHLPVSLALKAELQKAVLGVVTLATIGALQIPAPGCTLAIILLGDCKRYATAAGHKVKLQVSM